MSVRFIKKGGRGLMAFGGFGHIIAPWNEVANDDSPLAIVAAGLRDTQQPMIGDKTSLNRTQNLKFLTRDVFIGRL